MEEDNLLSVVPYVGSLAECEKLCDDSKACAFISYFGPQSTPLRNVCELFSTCSTLVECQDCTTEAELCWSCGQSLEGAFNFEENVIAVINGVEEEGSCKFACRDHPACQAYTFHDSSNEVFPKACFLLSEIIGPVNTCEHCSTGFPDCKNQPPGVCGLHFGDLPRRPVFVGANNQTDRLRSNGSSADGLTSHLLFNQTGATEIFVTALGSCELKLVAMGGGGICHASDEGDRNRGGGGSGYVASTSVLGAATSKLLATVGAAFSHSSVGVVGPDSVLELLRAEAGGNGTSSGSGGDGYSGGGPAGSGDRHPEPGEGHGGSNGRDGCCDDSVGRGSGLHLSDINLKYFALTPGAGGHPDIYEAEIGTGDWFHFGGGGGGVLVDGAGPPHARLTEGEGFGGGCGCPLWDQGDSPHQGVVLMEIYGK